MIREVVDSAVQPSVGAPLAAAARCCDMHGRTCRRRRTVTARRAACLGLTLLAFGLALPATAGAGTERVSVTSAGGQAAGMSLDPSISASGRFVAFTSLAANLVAGDTNGYSDVFVHDRRTGRTTRVSVSSRGRQGNRGSYAAAISASGRHVAFCSYASSLAGRDRPPRGLRDPSSSRTETCSCTTGPRGGRGW